MQALPRWKGADAGSAPELLSKMTRHSSVEVAQQDRLRLLRHEKDAREDVRYLTRGG